MEATTEKENPTKKSLYLFTQTETTKTTKQEYMEIPPDLIEQSRSSIPEKVQLGQEKTILNRLHRGYSKKRPGLEEEASPWDEISVGKTGPKTLEQLLARDTTKTLKTRQENLLSKLSSRAAVISLSAIIGGFALIITGIFSHVFFYGLAGFAWVSIGFLHTRAITK